MRGGLDAWIVLPLLVASCAADPHLPVASPDEPVARQPDGVALDLSAAHVTGQTSAEARGVIALVAPPSRAESLTLVRAYFRGFLGSARDFMPLLAHDAHRLGEPGATNDLLASLDRRLRSLDYAHVPLERAVGYDDARIVPYDAATREQRKLYALTEGDFYVDVPIVAPQFASVRLFGPNVVLVFRRDATDQWRIAAVAEDGPWP